MILSFSLNALRVVSHNSFFSSVKASFPKGICVRAITSFFGKKYVIQTHERTFFSFWYSVWRRGFKVIAWGIEPTIKRWGFLFGFFVLVTATGWGTTADGRKVHSAHSAPAHTADGWGFRGEGWWFLAAGDRDDSSSSREGYSGPWLQAPPVCSWQSLDAIIDH